MGNARIRPSIPDLFATESKRRPPTLGSPIPVAGLPAVARERSTPASARYALPNDLPIAVSQLDDQQFDRLLSAVLAEQKRRVKNIQELDQSDSRRQADEIVTLAQGKVKAVRAAFRAGVTPSQIARHFRISQSDVRKALQSDALKR